MKCPKCNTDNPDTLKFCGECGTQLPSIKDVEVTETMETPKEELTTGSTFAGRYQIIEELGRGGMGRVYKTIDTKIKEKIALKLIKPEIAKDKKTIERFSNELRLARKIRHKNICQMFDLGEDRGTHFITMEFVEGQDLKKLIRQSGQLAIGTTIKIAKQVCDGLAEAHTSGVVHRDLKPSNIMIDDDGNARIMDFGIARSLEAKGITGAGVMIGTPEYMSPEQVEGKEVDQRSDVYSLGVILYEMIAGKVPFEGDTAISIAMKHKSEIPKDPKEYNAQISDDLSKLIVKCLEKAKERRYQNAGEVKAELESIEKGIPTTSQEIPRRKPLASKEITVTFGLKRLLVPALIFIAVLIIGVLIWQLLPEKGVFPSESVKPSIAILPFDDLSPEKDQEYFCDGLTDELINRFTKIEKLRVPARTSVFSLKGKALNTREIGEMLEVANILEGSLHRTGKKLRITVQLINVADGSSIWSAKYEKDEKDIFSLQDEISLEIVNALQVKLLGEERSKVTKRYTDNKEAYDLYLKGLWIYNNKATEEEWRKAIKYFEQAIEIDPDFSMAYVGLARTYRSLTVFHYIPADDAIPKMKKALLQALEIDKDLAEAYSQLGMVKFRFEWDWANGEADIKKALELNPNDPDAHWSLAGILLARGQINEALKESRISFELDPLSIRRKSSYAFSLYITRNYDAALDQGNQVLALKQDYPPTYGIMGICYIQKEQFQDSITALEKAYKLSDNSTEIMCYLARGYAASGDSEKAKKTLEELDEISRIRYVSHYYLAIVYTALREMDNAFENLELAYKDHDSDLVMLNAEPGFDTLRSDPRYEVMLKKIGLAK